MYYTVVKLGGSVLTGIADSARILELLSGYPGPLVVVVSALKGTTDRLIAVGRGAHAGNLASVLYEKHLAFAVSFEPAPEALRWACERLAALRDELGRLLSGSWMPHDRFSRIASFGERLCATCLTAAFSRLGRDAALLEPGELGLVARGTEEDAEAEMEASAPRVRAAVRGHATAVVPGYYGVGEEGEVRLFGRGGSDYSAAVLAACLGARSCELVKDSAGVLTADPALVSGARHVDQLSYREAAELATGGARIIHPRAVRPLEAAGIPLRVIGAGRRGRSTLVGPRREGSPLGARAIALGSGPCGTTSLTIAGEGSAAGAAVAVLGAFRERGLFPKAFSARRGRASFRILVEAASGPDALRVAHEALFGAQAGNERS